MYDFDLLPGMLDSEEGLPDNQCWKKEFIANELRECCQSGSNFENLNQKYFAKKSLSCLVRAELESDVTEFGLLALEEKDLEEGAFLIAKWFQPASTFNLLDVKRKLDVYALQVKQALSKSNPNHPIFTRGSEIPQSMIELKGSLWNTRDCRLIISAIEETLKPLFQSKLCIKSYFVPQNSFINLVLENLQGIPISLCLIVSAVCRRLGFILEPVNFPRHFVLRWMEHPARSGIDRYTFVDVYNGNYSLTFDDLVTEFSRPPDMSISTEICKSCSTDTVLERMLRNLIALGQRHHSTRDIDLMDQACQLFVLFFPQDLNIKLLTIQIHLHLGLNIPQALDIIRDLLIAVPWMRDRLAQLQRMCTAAIQEARDTEVTSVVKRRADFPEVFYLYFAVH